MTKMFLLFLILLLFEGMKIEMLFAFLCQSDINSTSVQARICIFMRAEYVMPSSSSTAIARPSIAELKISKVYVWE